jgi:iron(III) transport system ATP-binding protein
MTVPIKLPTNYKDYRPLANGRFSATILFMSYKNTVICQHLHKSFADTPIICNISFTIKQGDILALLGPSGCGKTTTLRLIAGFESLDKGYIEINGRTVADDGFSLPPEKRRVGMVFQDYAIFPHLSVAQNVAFGLGRGPQANERTATMLQMVGLANQGTKMPHELSGGQQQRVALARALALDPAVVLLDEPFSNLDTALRQQVRREVKDLLKQNEATAVFVTHDQEEALFLGDQIAVMNKGLIEQLGTPEEIFHRPRTRFVAEFMGKTDFVPGQVSGQGIETALGRLPLPQSHPALSAGTAVTLAIRPDDVALTAANGDDAGNGRIISRQFTGIAYIYQVRLNDGSLIHSWQFHTLNLPPGTAVQASLRPDHTVTAFHGDRAI